MYCPNWYGLFSLLLFVGSTQMTLPQTNPLTAHVTMPRYTYRIPGQEMSRHHMPLLPADDSLCRSSHSSHGRDRQSVRDEYGHFRPNLLPKNCLVTRSRTTQQAPCVCIICTKYAACVSILGLQKQQQRKLTIQSVASWGERIHSNSWTLKPFRDCPRILWFVCSVNWSNHIVSRQITSNQTNRPTNSSNKQTNKQTNKQSINQSINQSTNQPTNQTTNQPTNQPTKRTHWKGQYYLPKKQTLLYMLYVYYTYSSSRSVSFQNLRKPSCNDFVFERFCWNFL